jgi:hypothetical protein
MRALVVFTTRIWCSARQLQEIPAEGLEGAKLVPGSFGAIGKVLVIFPGAWRAKTGHWKWLHKAVHVDGT